MQNRIHLALPIIVKSHAGFKKLISAFEKNANIVINDQVDEIHLFAHYTNLLLANELDVAILPLQLIPIDLPLDIVIAALSDRHLEGTTIVVNLESVDMSGELRLASGTKMMAHSNFGASQITALNPNVKIMEVEPNTEVKLQALKNKICDAILIDRMTYESIAHQTQPYKVIHLNPREIIPSPGSGVLSCITHRENIEIRTKLKSVHNKEVAELTNIERKIQKMAGSKYLGQIGAYVYQDAIRNFHASAVQSKIFHHVHHSQSTSSGLPELIIKALHINN